VRFALVGYGAWGRHHAAAIRQTVGAELVGIACGGERTAAARQDHPDVPVVLDYRALLDRPDVDAADVVVPNDRHVEVATAALARGKDVLLEKPMAATVEGCDRLLAVKTLETLARATEEGAINKVSWTGRWVENNGAFASGTVGLHHAHAPAFFYVRGGGKWVGPDTLGVAHMPGGYATPNSHGFGISKSSKHPDIAWDFIKLITNEKWAFTFGTTLKNLTGTRADQRILEYFRKEDPLAAEVLQTQVEHLDRLVATWPQAKDAEVKEAFYAEIQAALLGRKKAAEALAEAERKVNRILR
jgi:ABC-type glycerol-3-phosphate transport system substrate-binding protein